MKTKILAVLSLLMLIFLFSRMDSRSTERKINYPLDIMGKGGAGLTSHANFGMLFMNPAAFALYKDLTVSLLKIGASINYDWYQFYTIYDTLSRSGGDLSALSSEQWKTLLNLRAMVGVTGPLAIGYIYDSIGFLLYNDILTSMVVKQSPGLPYVDFGSYMDVGCLTGFGFEFPLPVFLGKFIKGYGGLSIKFINRFKVEDHRMSIIEAYDMGLSLLSFQKGFLLGQAIGSDFGFMIKSEDWAFGLVLRDWFNTSFFWREYDANFKPIENSTNKYEPTYWGFQMDIGGSYTLHDVLPNYFISDLSFYMDLANITEWSENFFLKVRIGAETTMFTFLKIRGGIYKGYPTAGLGFVLPFVTINIAYFTEELGPLPGSLPQQNLALDVQIIL